MLQPDITLGPLTLHFYGLFIGLGLFFVYQYLKRNSSKYNLNFSQVELGFILILFSALLGARFYHILSSWSYYQTNLGEIFDFWQGGLGIFGALLGGTVASFIYCHFKKISWKSFLNLFAPPLLMVQAIGRLGNFFNQEGFGPPTNFPWKIYISPQYRPENFQGFSYFHPTFFYETILCLIFFLIFLWLSKRTKGNDFGLAYYLISYGLIRFFTEFFRIDTWQIGNFKISFFFSGLMVILGVYLLKKTIQHVII